jgi:hypothetical protein
LEANSNLRQKNFEGVIDLLRLKAYYFEGAMGGKSCLKRKFLKI